MRTLICGSIAYDTIMVFRDRFKNHILPDRLHILNVAFLVPDMRREFGGCAGNIAYTLNLLGGAPVIMATVGEDALPYAQRLDRLRLARDHVRRVPDTFTAQAFITTDLDDNQITAFHPGAMNHSHENHVHEAADIGLGIVAPDGREGMLQHAREFHAAGIPFIFDPGQGLPMFSGEELIEFVRLATYVTVNGGRDAAGAHRAPHRGAGEVRLGVRGHARLARLAHLHRWPAPRHTVRQGGGGRRSDRLR
jgi:adenosine kinase